jgi:hypothetical protein
MRDIRPDLRERIQARHAAREEAAQKLDEIEDEIEALDALLASEEQRVTIETMVERIHSVPPENLDDFLVKAVERGVSAKTELRDTAIRANYFVLSEKNPGRVVHARLLHLVKDGRLRMDAKGGFIPHAEFKIGPKAEARLKVEESKA